MPKAPSKMQSWQVFHFARKHLGASKLYSLFGKKNARAIDYWCEDPRFTAKNEGAYDPLQGVKNLLDILDDNGHCGTVRATMAYLSADTSCNTEQEAIVDPLPTISEELLADFRAVASLQTAIETGRDLNHIEILKREAIAEIERTVAKYRKDCQ